MNNALERLQQSLKEFFQIEAAAALDFGIYGVMRYKRAEITAFADENRFPKIVSEALQSGALSRLSAHAEERRQVTGQIRENVGQDAISPSGELNIIFDATPSARGAWLYCLTFDAVPEDLHPQIAENDAQYKEWEKLRIVSEPRPSRERQRRTAQRLLVAEDQPCEAAELACYI